MLAAQNYIGKKVKILVDRALGSQHPKHGFIYEVNYGFVPGTISGDGEELDAYVLNVSQPMAEFEGVCIGVVHRTNDDDDKLVIAPEEKIYTKQQIEALVEFQERFFEHEIIEEIDNIKNKGEER